MNDQQAKGKLNGLAVTSLVTGILSWLLAIGLACLNWIILPIITIATMGVGGVLYFCTLAAACLSPAGWLVGTITGYVAKNQIRQSGMEGAIMANSGLIMNVIGLTITILLVCMGAIFSLMGLLDTSSLLNY